jgi:protein LTV1
LLYREQADPRIHEEGASEVVFHEVGTSKPHRGRNRVELEEELFGASSLDDEASLDSEDATSEASYHIRANEGEAAEHGVYFDDTEYDYMQHLRDLGGPSEGGQAVWIDAPDERSTKGKKKVDLDEALREMGLDDSNRQVPKAASIADSEASQRSAHSVSTNASRITDASMLPSTSLRHMTYQDQQAVPDALAGFQPDMDLRLREVLEALDDDAYIDTDAKDDSFFGSIANDREEVTLGEFKRLGADIEDEDDGWESDDTAKPTKEYQDGVFPSNEVPDADSIPADDHHGDGEFMANFRNLPKAARAANTRPKGGGSLLTASSALTTGGRHKKRKGAKTSSEAFSMTSSSLARTDALNTLDARFEKTLETYLEDDEADDDISSMVSGRESNMSGFSGVSKGSGVSRGSKAGFIEDGKFNDIMDEFLGSYSHTGKRRVVRGKPQTGMEQLDEIRRDLGGRSGVAAKVAP